MSFVKNALIALGLTASLAAHATTSGDIGFEAGLSGWTSNNSFSFFYEYGSTSDPENLFLGPISKPVFGGTADFGNYYGYLKAAETDAGGPDGFGNPLYTELSGSFSFQQGQTLHIATQWNGIDMFPDSAWIKINGTTVYSATSNPAVLAWENTNYTFSSTGNYDIKIGVINSAGFPIDSSQLRVDFSVSAVPEPETYAMMLAGLGAVGFMSRRRRAKTA